MQCFSLKKLKLEFGGRFFYNVNNLVLCWRAGHEECHIPERQHSVCSCEALLKLCVCACVCHTTALTGSRLFYPSTADYICFIIYLLVIYFPQSFQTIYCLKSVLPHWLEISIFRCPFVLPTTLSSIRPFRGHLLVSLLSCAFCCTLSLHFTLVSVASLWHGFLMTNIDPALCQTSLVAFILQQRWRNLETFLQEQTLFIRVWAENEPQVTEQLILPLRWL